MLALLFCAIPLLAQTAARRYEQQDSARFRVAYFAKDAGVVRDLWKVLRTRIPAVERDLGLALADTVTFVIAPDAKEWGRLTEGAPLWTNGLAYSQRGIAILKSPSFGQQYGPFPTTAVHEYVHLLLHAGAPRAEIPRWVDEGLAQFLSGQMDFMETAILARAAAANQLHSFNQIESVMAMSGLEARQAYAESAVAVQLLQQRFGMSGLSNLVHELRTGRDPDDAFSTVFGMSPGTFENQYREYLRKTYRLTLFGDTELWLSAAFVILILAAGTVVWVRRRRTLAKWADEEHHAHEEEVAPPPYIVNYTIIRSRQSEGGETPDDNSASPSDRPPTS